MSFFSDYIERSDDLIAKTTEGLKRGRFTHMDSELITSLRRDLWFMKYVTGFMRECRIVKLAGDQAMMFVGMPVIAEQDYEQLRSPFPRLYIDMIESPFVLKDYKDVDSQITHNQVNVRGVMLCELAPSVLAGESDVVTWEYGFPEEIVKVSTRLIQATFFAPQRESIGPSPVPPNCRRIRRRIR